MTRNLKPNTILFIPDAHYLSDPIYTRLAANKIEKFNYFYFLTNFPMNFVQRYESSKIDQKLFDKIYIQNNPNKEFLFSIIYKANLKYKIKNLIKFIKLYKFYRKEVYNTLNELSPSIIVATTDMLLINRDIYKWALSKKIPFVVYQSAFLESPHYNFTTNVKNYLYRICFNRLLNIPLGRYNNLYGNEFKDSYLFLWGEYFKKDYNSKKADDKIKYVGNPYYEEIIARSKFNINRIMSDLPKENLNILICTNDLTGFLTKEEIEKIFTIYQKAIIENPNHHFIFKIHPGESEQKYESLFNKEKVKNYSVETKQTMTQLLGYAHIQVSIGSLTSFEAILSGIPIIIINSKLLKIADHFNDKLDEKVYNYDEFNKKISFMNSASVYESFLLKREDYINKLMQLDSVTRFNNTIKQILNNEL
ncbi:MAG: hypothetical protein QY331_07400 [Melioribacteraceae bacterium]|jgi:hypothetical protein|nr:MAG: hypothetical protein QY331_07400 [Melioribacteraceae bacterium]